MEVVIICTAVRRWRGVGDVEGRGKMLRSLHKRGGGSVCRSARACVFWRVPDTVGMRAEGRTSQYEMSDPMAGSYTL